MIKVSFHKRFKRILIYTIHIFHSREIIKILNCFFDSKVTSFAWVKRNWNRIPNLFKFTSCFIELFSHNSLSCLYNIDWIVYKVRIISRKLQSKCKIKTIFFHSKPFRRSNIPFRRDDFWILFNKKFWTNKDCLNTY